MSEDDIIKLKEEKERLIEENRVKVEKSKLKKEIFMLRNPMLIKTVNFFGNIGDKVLGFVSGDKNKNVKDRQDSGKHERLAIRNYYETKSVDKSLERKVEPKKVEKKARHLEQPDIMKSVDKSVKDVEDIIKRYDNF